MNDTTRISVNRDGSIDIEGRASCIEEDTDFFDIIPGDIAEKIAIEIISKRRPDALPKELTKTFGT